MSEPEAHPIILFDGVCNLCAWAVRFIIERDPRAVFRFTSLQSDIGQQLLIDHQLDPQNMDSFILIEDGAAHQQSTAALKVARHLSGAWPLLHAFIVLPTFLRDPLYRLIARNRYRWFGKEETCMVPTPELRARFL
jgi:predicted DCC family thiol-disulfide oxidoreductase YuxK